MLIIYRTKICSILAAIMAGSSITMFYTIRKFLINFTESIFKFIWINLAKFHLPIPSYALRPTAKPFSFAKLPV